LWYSEEVKEDEAGEEAEAQQLPSWLTDNLNAVRNMAGGEELREDEIEGEDADEEEDEEGEDNNNNSLEFNHNEYMFDGMRRLVNNRVGSGWVEEATAEGLVFEDEDWAGGAKAAAGEVDRRSVNSNNEEVDEDDEEGFDAYLQDYIDMYTSEKGGVRGDKGMMGESGNSGGRISCEDEVSVRTFEGLLIY